MRFFISSAAKFSQPDIRGYSNISMNVSYGVDWDVWLKDYKYKPLLHLILQALKKEWEK